MTTGGNTLSVNDQDHILFYVCSLALFWFVAVVRRFHLYQSVSRTCLARTRFKSDSFIKLMPPCEKQPGQMVGLS